MRRAGFFSVPAAAAFARPGAAAAMAAAVAEVGGPPFVPPPGPGPEGEAREKKAISFQSFIQQCYSCPWKIFPVSSGSPTLRDEM